MKIGGIARMVFVPESEGEFCGLISKYPDIPIIAGGSNTLISDKFFEHILFLEKKFFEPVFLNNYVMDVSAPHRVGELIYLMSSNNLSGLEIMAGVPRLTIGGAIYNNFGAFGLSISEQVISVKALDKNNRIIELAGPDCEFDYRTSIFKTNGYKIISAKIQCGPTTLSVLTEQLKNIISFRKEHQPLAYPNIGSIFKNPKGNFAGKLIEDCGLKGTDIGGAQIWPGHANFFINRGNATYADMRQLIKTIQQEVMKKFKIYLETEISILE